MENKNLDNSLRTNDLTVFYISHWWQELISRHGIPVIIRLADNDRQIHIINAKTETIEASLDTAQITVADFAINRIFIKSDGKRYIFFLRDKKGGRPVLELSSTGGGGAFNFLQLTNQIERQQSALDHFRVAISHNNSTVKIVRPNYLKVIGWTFLIGFAVIFIGILWLWLQLGNKS